MFLLAPFALLYGTAIRFRNYLYDQRVLPVKELPVPVISVGNLSTGGSGKTSLTQFLARELSGSYKTAIVLRGYRRRSKGLVVVSEYGELKVPHYEAGDEAFLLAKLVPQASVVVSESKYEGGLYAVRELGSQVVVLDDGFQHRSLHRDIDIVLVRRKDLADRLLPWGRLREPVSSLKRADAIVLSYQELEPFSLSYSGKPVFSMYRRFGFLLNSNFDKLPLEFITGKEVIAFCGLGSNDQFLETLKKLGINVRRFISFPDHYDYQNFKLDKEEFYITTPKDLVKLPPAENVFALGFELEVRGLLSFVKEKLHL